MHKFQPGDKVRLTGKFLRNTGQQRGSEGVSRWVVQACECNLCASGAHVKTNQPFPFPEQTWPDLVGTPEYESTLKWRHIATGNLEKCK